MDKKILTIVSVILALIFVTALTIIYTNVNDLSSEASNDISNVDKSIDKTRLEQFDNKYVYGDTVRYAIDNMTELSDGTKMSFVVYNNNTGLTSSAYYIQYGYGAIKYNSTSYVVEYTGSYLSTPVKSNKITATSSYNYIFPDFKYSSKLVTNDSGKVVGIFFSRVNN